MALVVNDRVKETSTTTGTGTFTLDGAVTGFETFSSAIGNTNTTYYAIVNTSDGAFEVGLGTVGAGTLARTTIISSSNSDSAVDFAAGTKNVFVTLPASKSVILDSSGNIVANNGSNLTNLNADNLASGTVPDARFPATLPAADGSALTALNATQLTSGTVPDARFPATLPAVSGANLTNLDADDLASGTVPDARFPATLPAVSGANLTNLDADDLASGTVPDARFPATLPAASGVNLTALNASNVASGTLSSDRLPTVPTTKGGTGLTAIGTANQVLAVNSGGTALEYQTPEVGDITAVTAGSGLTGGGTTGDVTLNVGAGTGVTVNADDIAIGQDVATSASPTFAGLTTTADINFGDNDKAVFGTGNDTELYNDGSSFYLDNTNGNIQIRTFSDDRDIFLVSDDGSGGNASYLQVDGSTGSINLRHYGAIKLATTSSGVDVTGTMAATTFSGSGASLTNIPNGALDNSAITINGTSTSLGGSINVGDITGVTAGTLLDGGGTTGTVTLNVDLSELTTSTTDGDGDFFAVVDASNVQRKLTKANINISGFNNDSGFTTNTGTVTSVSGGNGLTGSVTTSGSLAVGAGTLIDVTADAVSVDLSELTTSTSNTDGDFFVVVDSANAQKKLTKGNINISGFNNDAGYTTNVGDITGVTAGTNLTGGGSSGSVTLNMATGGVGAGTYGSTANATKIDTITVDAYGRVTAVATGATGDGDITGVTAGTLLDGGGTSGSVTLNVDLSELSTSTTNGDGDYFVVVDTANAQRKLTKGNINISGFNNDAGYTTNTGDITGVTAGNGLTGGGSSGSVTLNVGAGTGINVAADTIAVDVSDFMTNGSNNRIVTATGTDGMNAETNLNFDGTSLNINGNINDVTDIYLEDQIFHAGDTDTYMQFHAANQWRVVTGGTEMLECNDSDVKITNGDLIPSAGETQDLGSSGSPWRNLYTGDLHLSNKGHSEGNSIDGTKGDWTIQEGENDLYILNNKSGKKYKFKLEEM